MLKALRHRPITRLWMGQALSSIGDEIYRVGLTWMAVQLIGEDTGYLTAGQFAALMVLSFLGGKWADHWEPLKTMVSVDVFRAFVVAIPVAYSFYAPVPLSLLVAVALLLAGLSAFFDPALQSLLPRFSPDIYTLRAATGLMATTIRLARLVGPGLVGLFAGVIPFIHFFTLNAISFLASAYSIHGLDPAAKKNFIRTENKLGVFATIASGVRSVTAVPGLTFVFCAKAITGGTWNLAYYLGFALLIQQQAANDARAFGLLIAAYGLGNFAGAMCFGNMHRPRPALIMFIGFIWLGLGFAMMALVSSMTWILVAAAFAGFSGSANEITFFDLIQNHFSVSEIPRVTRLRMAADTTISLVLMLMAPAIFRWLPARSVIGYCGLLWIVVGLWGLLFFVRRFEAPTNQTSAEVLERDKTSPISSTCPALTSNMVAQVIRSDCEFKPN